MSVRNAQQLHLAKTTRCVMFAAVAATAILTASAWDKLYWTGATSTDYSLPANWNSNNVDTVSGVDPTQWRVGWDQVYDDDHAQTYRIDVAGKYSTRGPWTFNGGTDQTPFEIHCDNDANGISPNYSAFSKVYNYASSLMLGDSAETWVWFNGGRYEAFNGTGTIGSADYAGHLILGNDSVSTVMAFSNTVYLAQGSLVSTNADLMTEKEMQIGSTAGLTALVDKTGGDWVCKGTFKIANAQNATASFYHRGGTLTTGPWFGVGGGDGTSTRSYLEISGGTVRNGNRDITVGDYGQIGARSEIFVKGDGKMISGRNVIVGARAAGVLTIEGNGLVTASNCTKICNDATCEAGEDCVINLNGGVLETKYVQYGSGAANGTIAFNGGTLRAYADNQTLIYGNNKLSVTATALGGAIDTAGYAVTIAEDIADATGETGTMTFKGGGKATLNVAPVYTGGTTIELGTTLVVPSAIAGSSLTVAVPVGTAKGVYEVVRISGEGMFADGTASAIMCADANAQFVLNADKTAVVCVYGYETDENAYIGGNGGSLSVEVNWLKGTVPTSGNITFGFGIATTVAVGDTFRADTITISDTSAVMTIGGGNLQLNTLTNASRLVIANGASLTIANDLVAYAANNTKPLLYSNEGTVTVGGKVRFRSNSLINRAESTVCQYEVVSANTSPIITKGLAYDAQYQPDGSWYPDYLVANLGSMDNGPGKWVIGADGTSYPRSRVIDRSGFRVTGNQSVTLHSSADWVLDETYRHTGNDLYIANTASVTIDTTDWTDGTTPRTVTLKGFVNVTSSHATPLVITGCGRVIFDTAAGNGDDKNKVNSVLAVLNGATLEIKDGKTIAGSGTISLAAGTTLSLESTARTFAEPDIIPVTLPETGKATIKIDGTRLGSDQDFVVCSLTDLPEGCNVADHVIMTGTAINGRKCKVKAVEVTENEKTVTKLVANISPTGLILTFK